MATTFPGSLDNFVNPNPADKLNNPSHSTQHTNANDAIEAIEGYVGVSSATGNTTLTGRIKALEAGTGTAGIADSVDNLNSTSPLFQWTGTQAQYDALGVWDSNTFYTITDAPSEPLPSDVMRTGVTETVTGIKTIKAPLIFESVTTGVKASMQITLDPLSSLGEALVIDDVSGTVIASPYIVLDTSNLQTTMPGALDGSPLIATVTDSFGVTSLGWGSIAPVSRSWTDTHDANVVIKAAGVVTPSAWVSLGLIVTPDINVEAGGATLSFEMVISNNTSHSGVLEYGLKVAGAAPLTRNVVVQVPANFNQTVGFALPLTSGYTANQSLELVARVTTQSNNNFAVSMLASPSDLAAIRFAVTGAVSGVVTEVSATLPLVSTGGSTPNLSIPRASVTVDGYLDNEDFVTFNNKAGLGTNNTWTGTNTFTGAVTMGQSDGGEGGEILWNDPSNAGSLITMDVNPTGRMRIFQGVAPNKGVYIDLPNGGAGSDANVLTSVNYNNYSPTLGGGGASGAWNISAKTLYEQTSAADLNDQQVSGFYRVNAGMLNTPVATGGAYGQLIVSKNSDTIAQIYTDHGTGELYSRAWSSSLGWSVWRKYVYLNNNNSVHVSSLRTDYSWGQAQFIAETPTSAVADMASVSFHVQDSSNAPQVGFSFQDGSSKVGFFDTTGAPTFIKSLDNGFVYNADKILVQNTIAGQAHDIRSGSQSDYDASPKAATTIFFIY